MTAIRTYRVVACGLEDRSRTQVVAADLASKLSATPKQIEQILLSSHFVLAKDLEIKAAERYAETLRGAGAYWPQNRAYDGTEAPRATKQLGV